jgi:hypothetical protein
MIVDYNMRMKKIVITLLICFACNLQLTAQSDTTHPSSAQIYILRATGFGGSLVNFRSWVNDFVICKLANNHYSVHHIKPGTYTFYATSFDTYKMQQNGFEMQVEAGKTYYLRMVIKKRMFDSFLYLQDITENSATSVLSKCKHQEDCKL